MRATPAQTDRLTALFRQHSHRVYAYARRHTDQAAAQDVVAEVFLVAWRRLDRVPEPDDQSLPWLLAVARNLLANHRRSLTRQARLQAELAATREAAAISPGADNVVADREAMLAALARLTDGEREAVLLTAWDGLGAQAAATVAGCSARAFTVRLHRARRRLGRELAAPDDPALSVTPAARVTSAAPATSATPATSTKPGPTHLDPALETR